MKNKEWLCLLLTVCLLLCSCSAPAEPVQPDSSSSVPEAAVAEPEAIPEPESTSESTPEPTSEPEPELAPEPEPEPLGDWEWCWVPSDTPRQGEWAPLVQIPEGFGSWEKTWLTWLEAPNRVTFTSYIGPHNSSELRKFLNSWTEFKWDQFQAINQGKYICLMNNIVYNESTLEDGSVRYSRLSPEGDHVYSYCTVGERVFYLTDAAVWSVDFEGNDRKLVCRFEEDAPVQITADSYVLYLHAGDTLRCVYHPTGEEICAWQVEDLAEWYPVSIHEMRFSFFITPTDPQLDNSDGYYTSRSVLFDNRTGNAKVWEYVFTGQDPAEAREKVQAENPTWLQEMTALGYTWEDVFVPHT